MVAIREAGKARFWLAAAIYNRSSGSIEFQRKGAFIIVSAVFHGEEDGESPVNAAAYLLPSCQLLTMTPRASERERERERGWGERDRQTDRQDRQTGGGDRQTDTQGDRQRQRETERQK